jgi:hypothetical protein
MGKWKRWAKSSWMHVENELDGEIHFWAMHQPAQLQASQISRFGC